MEMCVLLFSMNLILCFYIFLIYLGNGYFYSSAPMVGLWLLRFFMEMEMCTIKRTPGDEPVQLSRFLIASKCENVDILRSPFDDHELGSNVACLAVKLRSTPLRKHANMRRTFSKT